MSASSNPAEIAGNFDRVKFLAKDLFLYGGTKAISLLGGFITFPILSRHFSIEDYGIIDLFSTFGAFIVTLIVFGQDSALGRYFYEYTEKKVRQELISQSLIFQIFILLILCPVIFFSGQIYIDKFGLEKLEDINFLLFFIILQVPFSVFIVFSQNLLKWSFSRTKFIFISIGSTFFYAISILIGIFYFDFQIINVFVIYFFTRLIFGLIGIFLCRSWIVLPKNLTYLKEMIWFAIPYGIICCISSFIPIMERSLVADLLGTEQLGLFAVGAKFSMLISFPIIAFQTAWGPFSLSLIKDKDATKTYNIVLKLFTLLISLAVIALTLISKPLIGILASDRYLLSYVLVFPICFGLMVQGVGWITEIGIGISKKTHLHLYSYFIYLSTSFTCIYFLGFIFGIEGVAWGTTIGLIVKAIVGTNFSIRVHNIEWSFANILMQLLNTIIFGFIIFLINNSNLNSGIVYFYFTLFFLFILISYNILFSKTEKFIIKEKFMFLLSNLSCLSK